MASAGNPTPDLVLAQKAKVGVLLDAQTCPGAAIDPASGAPVNAPACVSVNTPLRVLTPMGAYTEPGNSDVIYITDSPGPVSQVIRYTISKDTQDSYSNFGVLADGTVVQYAFAFSPTRGADGGLPSQKVGMLNGSGTPFPHGGVWLPGSLGGHLWVSDSADTFCRMDPNPSPGPSNPPTASGAPFALNVSTCNVFVTKPGQPAYDPNPQPDGTHFVYIPDGIAATRAWAWRD